MRARVTERVAALLMDALAAQGRQAEAPTLYARVCEGLADVLGSDPGSALRERHLRLPHAEAATSSAGHSGSKRAQMNSAGRAEISG